MIGRQSLATTALVVGFVLVLSGCNPHDQMPPPVCQQARHCEPGQLCVVGLCEAPGQVTVVVGSLAPTVRAQLLAAPADDGGWLESARARRVGEAQAPQPVPDSGAASFVFADVPRLPLAVLVWSGGEGGPCDGDRFALSPLSARARSTARVFVHETWVGECFRMPRRISYSDELVFPRR